MKKRTNSPGLKARAALKKLQQFRDSHKYNKHPLSFNIDYSFYRKMSAGPRFNQDIDTSALIGVHTLNKIKELDLKRKVREGGKIRVGFFVDGIDRFKARYIYQLMKKEKLFEPFILFADTQGSTDEDPIRQYNNWIKDMENDGYTVFPCYDKNFNYIPIENYHPDIVFVSMPYMDYAQWLISNFELHIKFLTCHLTYGFNVLNSYMYHYNNRQINMAWKYFVNTREDFNEIKRYSIHKGINAVLTGAPFMDVYGQPIAANAIPEKINNGRPIVIYAPHHTINSPYEVHDLATFDLYSQFFFELAKNNPDINFVFKPHRSLKYRVQESKVMTVDQYIDYCKDWDKLPNAIYLFDYSYIDLFRKSDLLITDAGSFIFEWLPTEKPCCYLVNPRRRPERFMEGFSTLARKILQTYYLCHDLDEFQHYFKMLMIDHIDPKKSNRYNIQNKVFYNLGHASEAAVQNIIDTICMA